MAITIVGALGVALGLTVLMGDEPRALENGVEKPQLRIASSSNISPINLLNAEVLLSSFARDLSEAVAEAIGVEPRYMDRDSWRNVVRSVDDGTVDLIHDTAYAPDRTEYLDFSDPIIEIPESIFVRGNTSDIHEFSSLREKKVALVGQNATDYYSRFSEEVQFYVMNTPADGLAALINGDVDALVSPEQIVLNVAQRLRFLDDIKKVGEPIRVLSWSMTVKKGNHELLAQLNSGIRAIKESGEYQRIYEQWFGRRLLSAYSKKEIVVMLAAALLLSLLVVVSISLALHVRAVRRASRKLAEAQKERLEREREQREILDSMVDAVITVDESGHILTFNETAEKKFGYGLDEILGENIKILLPEPYSDQFDRDMLDYLETGDARMFGMGREMRGRTISDDTFPMRLSMAELAKKSDGKRRFIGSCQDLTRIKSREEQLSRAQKMESLGKLTGGIAHDFNNMLGVVLGYSEILESDLADQPELQQSVREIHHASQRGAKLTKKLLDFSRQTPSEAKRLELNAVLESERDLLEKTLTARIGLEFDLGEELWAVWVDESDFEDALLNLSINAMHAMDGSGVLSIQTRNEHLDRLESQQLGLEPGEYVLFTLSDTGCGMDEETKEKMFEPFFSTKGSKGTGLGLSQVYGFVERCHGAIKVYSEPNVGTKFMLYFPRYIEEAYRDGREANLDNLHNLKGNESILIVDDERSLLDLASKILSRRGYATFCASNHQEALEVLDTEPIDLMFSDVIMPDMNGYELAMMVKEKHPEIIVLMTSGFTGDLQGDLMESGQIDGLVQKPYSSRTLLTSIRDALDRS